MDNWKIKSNPKKQTMFAIALIVIGGPITYLFRHFDTSSINIYFTVFLLGLLIILAGISGLLLTEKESVTVNSRECIITIEDESYFGKTKRVISFSEIEKLFVSSKSEKSDSIVSYYVTLQLKSRETYPLFYPAYYDGRWDKSVAEVRCRRLEEYLHQM